MMSRPGLAPTVVGFSFLMFIFAAWHFIDMRRQLRRADVIHAATRDAAVDSSSLRNGLESQLSAAAKKAGVQRLLGLNVRSISGARQIAIEWEANQAASLAFLASLQLIDGAGLCSDLLITPGSPPDLHVRALFDATRSGLPRDKGLPVETPHLARNVFTPLWRDAASAVAARAEREQKKSEQARVLQEKKQAADQRAQEQVQQTQAKKHGLENGLVVTGIVNNGREPMAFVSASSGGGQTLMLRNGDLVEEARVAAIDEKKGEVRLDYQGQFEVVLKLNSSGGAQ